MSLKYSSTTADYLQWSEAMNLIRKLARDSNYKMSLLIALGCFTGLRISDILALRWKMCIRDRRYANYKDIWTKYTFFSAVQCRNRSV